MEITYTGPHRSVSVPLDDGTEIEAAHGATVTVPDRDGKALLEQTSNWQPAKRRAGKGDD